SPAPSLHDALPILDDLGARGDRLPDARLLTALALEHALVPRDDDLEAGHSRRERLAERPDDLRDPVGVHGADPLDAEPAQRVGDPHPHRLVAGVRPGRRDVVLARGRDRKSTRLNSSHEWISYAV